MPERALCLASEDISSILAPMSGASEHSLQIGKHSHASDAFTMKKTAATIHLSPRHL